MRNFIICFFIFVYTIENGLCHAQSRENPLSEIDSLKQGLTITKDEKNKARLYLKILFYYLNTNAEEGLIFISPALELSEKINYKKAETKYYAGRIYWKLGKMDMALKLHFEALKICEEEKDDPRGILTAIGQDYADGGDYEKGLEYFIKVKELNIKVKDKQGLADTYGFISWIYTSLGNNSASAKYNLESYKLYVELKDEGGIAASASNIASDFIQLGKYEEAITYFLKCSVIQEKINDFVNLSNTYKELGSAYFYTNNFPQAFKYVELSYSIAKKFNERAAMGSAEIKIAEMYMLQQNFAKAIPHLRSSVTSFRAVNAYHNLVDNYNQLGICYLKTQQLIQAKNALDSSEYFSQKDYSRLYIKDYLYGRQLYDSIKGNWKSAYIQYHKYIDLRDSIFSADETKKLLQTHTQYEYDKKEADAKAAQEIKDILSFKELQRQKLMRNVFFSGFGVVIFFAGVFFTQRNRIGKEKKRSDELLLNILPEEVAEELKHKGSADAKQFNEVTVMFTDFKGFTQISEKLSPTELVNEIHTCFMAFNTIIEKYHVEKIKTIGDAYMCAGGLPVANKTHPVDVVNAALEIQKFMQLHSEQRKKENKPIFEIRIGVHTGPVVAGIVGLKKFAYDIWGDTVNIASRMESSGEARKVNISSSTYELVKNKFSCTHRGKIQAKNKGEIDMYFVESSI